MSDHLTQLLSPHASTSAEARLQRARRSDGHPARLVLIADELPVERAMLRGLLEGDGYDVCVVANTSELRGVLDAMDDGATRHPDLIVVELARHRGELFEVIDDLRVIGWAESVIVLTDPDEGAAEARVADLDGVVVVQRPFDRREMLRVAQLMTT